MPCKQDDSGNSPANGEDRGLREPMGSHTLTGQANGTIRCRIRQDKDLKVTFIPEGNYCVERWEKKFAVFLPIANDGSRNDGSRNDDSSSGFSIELKDHGGVELELVGAGFEESKPALLCAATHGTQVTVEVTRGDQEKLTLTAVTIPAE